MSYKTVFRRYELKYLITKDQMDTILGVMEPYTKPDAYGITTIRNLYFDTPSYRLIRESIEKPDYKEKLRIRSYTTATDESTVFVELKKKYEGVVYKRRLSLSEKDATDWIIRGLGLKQTSQISREIDYFIRYYENPSPKVYLAYDRTAYFGTSDPDLRITFDSNIIFREDDLSLKSPAYGTKILRDGYILMEIKTSASIPLWLTRTLAELGISKTSFSKYGVAYRNHILPKIQHITNTSSTIKESANDKQFI